MLHCLVCKIHVDCIVGVKPISYSGGVYPANVSYCQTCGSVLYISPESELSVKRQHMQEMQHKK